MTWSTLAACGRTARRALCGSWVAVRHTCQAAVVLLLSATAFAQNLEAVLSPGPLIRAHAKLESDCKSCHVRFDRAAQDGLCIACHKEVGVDLRQKSGWHGRQKPQPCRACHTDHRGRDVSIAEVDSRTFDHRLTDYVLSGRHAQVECRQCHAAGRKYRQAPSDCASCHRKDDAHRGALGPQCANCHRESRWKEASFDHDATRFKLAGRHVGTACAACHKTADYRQAPQNCVGCHRKDDKHRGVYGDACENCHDARAWTGIAFRHDVDTRFALRGRHRELRCESCHGGTLYRDKLGSACIDCHRKDDKHGGGLGPDCQNCHAERRWSEASRLDHDRSNFPLRGAHQKVECKACHATPRFRETPSDCVACHRAGDKHQGTLGKGCATCHTDANWKATKFDHGRTRFVLRGGHAAPPRRCAECHRDLASFRPTPLACVSCHRKDDRHESQLGGACEACHGDGAWRAGRFDHAHARFALSGAHVRVACKQCHASPRFRDAPRDCVGCHRKDDRHNARFGESCADCHGARDWRLWAFDHGRRTDYALEGAHQRAACEACHVGPAPQGRKTAPLERQCATCHRRDDVHDGSFGAQCDRCHRPTGWRQVDPGRPRTSRIDVDAHASGGRS